jgi:hypothetical protein
MYVCIYPNALVWFGSLYVYACHASYIIDPWAVAQARR